MPYRLSPRRLKWIAGLAIFAALIACNSPSAGTQTQPTATLPPATQAPLIIVATLPPTTEAPTQQQQATLVPTPTPNLIVTATETATAPNQTQGTPTSLPETDLK